MIESIKEIISVKVDDLNPSEYNPRQASDKQHQNLRESIEKFGVVDPLIVNSAENRKNVIIGGHFRLRVAKSMGYQEVPVVYVNIPEIEREKELNIRLNRNLGEWDWDLLANFDEKFLKEIGFDSQELDKIFKDKEDKDPDFIPAERATEIKVGDIYLLGTHKLMCGDATKEDVAKLMSDQKASMVFTDPPYNVNYQGSMNTHGKNEKKGILNDKMSDEEFYQFLYSSISNMMENCDGAFYICMASKELSNLYKAFKSAGGHWQNYIIWVKNHFTLSRSDYQQIYEPILYGWNSKNKNHYFVDHRNMANVWEDLRSVKTEFKEGYTIISFQGFKVKIKGKVEQGEVVRKKQKIDIWRYDKPSRNEEHPTMKPIALVQEAILNSSMREDIILDPFGGSGSTLIACEVNNRKCYTMELDPVFCQVIIDRWEKYTEQKARKQDV